MKTKNMARCGLGIVAVIAMVTFSLIMPTVIAAKNDWRIRINDFYVPRGTSCAAYTTGEDDHVVGTLEWEGTQDPGFDWYYSYDDIHWYGASWSWGGPLYFFDFYANDHGYDWGDYFKIQSFDPNPPNYYYCLLHP